MKIFAIHIFQKYIIQLLNVVFNFVCIKLLNTSDLGHLSIIKSIFGTYELAHAGSRYTIERFSQKKNIAKTLVGTSFLIHIVGSTLLSIAFFIYYRNLEVLLIGLSGAIYFLVNIVRVYHRSSGNLKYFVKISFVSDFLLMIFQLVLVVLYGLKGIYIGYCCASVVVFLFFYRDIASYFSVRSGQKKYLTLSFESWVLYLNVIVALLFSLGDKFYIEAVFGSHILGEYSIVLFFQTVLLLFALSFTELLSNKMLIKDGVSGKIQKIFISMALCVVVYLAYFFLIEWIVWLFADNYLYLVPSIKTIGISVIFVAFTSLAIYIFQVNNLKYLVLLSSVISMILYGLFVLSIKPASATILEDLVKFKLVYYVADFSILFASIFLFRKKLQ